MSAPAPIESVHQALRERAAQVLAQPVAQAVPSPCVAVCQMQPDTGWCWGCRRTLQEIADWSMLNTPQRRAVWEVVALRLTPIERSPHR
jgi:predicted Fe-S protein YdhL (DUF1289 family)